MFSKEVCGEANCVIRRMEDNDMGQEDPPDYQDLLLPGISKAFWNIVKEHSTESPNVAGKKKKLGSMTKQ